MNLDWKGRSQPISKVITSPAICPQNIRLSRDGRYLLRFFEKNDYEGDLYGYVIETGLSFVITVDYNRFKEIFQKQKKKVNGPDSKQKATTQ